MALNPLTYAEFKAEVTKRLAADGREVTKASVDAFFKAFIEETTDCLANGFAVTIPGLVKFTLAYTPAKRKGELVKPFGGGDPVPRAESKPAALRAKAYASASIKNALPKLTTNLGKQIAEMVKPAESKPAPAASKGGKDGKSTTSGKGTKGAK